MTHTSIDRGSFVHWIRQAAPYIRAFRNKTFIISFGGEALLDGTLPHLIHDLGLLTSVGIKLVLVPGARPQIEARLRARHLDLRYMQGLRVTDAASLECVKEAVAAVRLDLEAALSVAVSDSPMAGARVRVVSGNFIIARPIGVRDGVDFQHTGEVRRIDSTALRRHLEEGTIVLIPPLGYSPTGETFNLAASDVATAVAETLDAEKLIFLIEDAGLRDRQQQVVRQLSVEEAETILNKRQTLSRETVYHLQKAVAACRLGVKRVHIIDRRMDGSLLLELFTRDGVGTMIAAENYEQTVPATVDDIGGILALIQPLEERGILVRRPRELLELEIHHFIVMKRDNQVIGCAALYPFTDDQVAELACLAIHPEYQKSGRGDALLTYIENKAKTLGMKRLLVLTTHAIQWFQERGFQAVNVDDLPGQRRVYYNDQRNSRTLMKTLV